MKQIISTKIILGFLIGIIVGFLTFFLVYQDALQQGKMFSPDNFQTMTVTIIGKIDSISENSITVDRQGIKFPIEIKENTLILVPDEVAAKEIPESERPLVKEGELRDLHVGESVEAIASFSDNVFQAVRITSSPNFR